MAAFYLTAIVAPAPPATARAVGRGRASGAWAAALLFDNRIAGYTAKAALM